MNKEQYSPRVQVFDEMDWRMPLIENKEPLAINVSECESGTITVELGNRVGQVFKAIQTFYDASKNCGLSAREVFDIETGTLGERRRFFNLFLNRELQQEAEESPYSD